MKKRVTVFANGRATNGKVLFVPKKWNDFLARCSRKLGLPAPARRAFNVHGGELDCVELVQANDVLYISMGDDFREPQRSAPSPALSPAPVIRPRVQSMPPLVDHADHALRAVSADELSARRLARSASQRDDRDAAAPAKPSSGDTSHHAQKPSDADASNVESAQAAVGSSMPVLHDNWLRLNVGGRVFVTTRSTLTHNGNNMLAHMFGSEWHSATDATGAYLIDRSPEYFVPLLNYLRCGALHLDPNVNVENVLEEARFFGLTNLLPELERLAKVADPEQPAFSRKDLARVLMSSETRSSLRARGLNFEDADLSNLDLRGINFSRAKFARANLENAVLDGCNLSEANLSNAQLSGATLRGAVLTGATLEGANARGVVMSVLHDQPANAESVNFKGAQLEDSILSGSSFRCCNFRGATLTNADMGRSDLAGANFEGASLKGTNLSKANLKGCNLRLATFDSRTGL